jgi:hypothetical protein
MIVLDDMDHSRQGRRQVLEQAGSLAGLRG